MRKLMTCCLDLALAMGVTGGVALAARTMESELGRWSPLMVWDATPDGPELACVRDGGERHVVADTGESTGDGAELAGA